MAGQKTPVQVALAELRKHERAIKLKQAALRTAQSGPRRGERVKAPATVHSITRPTTRQAQQHDARQEAFTQSQPAVIENLQTQIADLQLRAAAARQEWEGLRDGLPADGDVELGGREDQEVERLVARDREEHLVIDRPKVIPGTIIALPKDDTPITLTLESNIVHRPKLHKRVVECRVVGEPLGWGRNGVAIQVKEVGGEERVRAIKLGRKETIQAEIKIQLDMARSCSAGVLVLAEHRKAARILWDGAAADVTCISMDVGIPLAEVIHRLQPVDLEIPDGPALRHGIRRVFDLIDGVVYAVSAVHQAGWILNDIKPENILLVPRSASPTLDYSPSSTTTKLCDLECAQRLDIKQDESGGTEPYMGPRSFQRHSWALLYKCGDERPAGWTGAEWAELLRYRELRPMTPERPLPQNDWYSVGMLTLRVLLEKNADQTPAGAVAGIYAKTHSLQILEESIEQCRLGRYIAQMEDNEVWFKRLWGKKREYRIEMSSFLGEATADLVGPFLDSCFQDPDDLAPPMSLVGRVAVTSMGLRLSLM